MMGLVSSHDLIMTDCTGYDYSIGVVCVCGILGVSRKRIRLTSQICIQYSQVQASIRQLQWDMGVLGQEQHALTLSS